MESITIETVCPKCGSIVIRSVMGNTREQALKNAELVKAGFEECAMCFDLAREAEINKKLADARKMAQELHLPAIVRGSRKQIDWAESIRIEKYLDVKRELQNRQELLNQYLSVTGVDMKNAIDITRKEERMLTQLLHQIADGLEQAGFWIQCRNYTTWELFKSLFPGEYEELIPAWGFID